jgi:hypothetical protein
LVCFFFFFSITDSVFSFVIASSSGVSVFPYRNDYFQSFYNRQVSVKFSHSMHPFEDITCSEWKENEDSAHVRSYIL